MKVTPLAGVWIEIMMKVRTEIITASLPSRECGLKLEEIDLYIEAYSHSPRGSVD